jgi:acetyl-CoA synthetase
MLWLRNCEGGFGMVTAPKRYDAHLKLFGDTAHIRGLREYQDLYKRSLEDVESFWSEQARAYLSWEQEWDFVLRHDVDEARVEWFGGGILNAAHNCLDRHLDTSGDTVAYYWEGDGTSESRSVTYSEMYEAVNGLAAVLKSRGVGKGDLVVIYLPMVVECAVAMLACARIGAVHCAVFVGCGAESLADRIEQTRSRVIITSDGGWSNGNVFPVKQRLDDALTRCGWVDTVVVLDRCHLTPHMKPGRDIWWHEGIEGLSVPVDVAPEPMSAEDPLFVAFAGTNAGKPKALVHTHGGYLLWAAMTSRLIFDLRDHDVFWCTAVLAGLTGHSLGVYGPLLNGISAVIVENGPDDPDCGRYWRIIDKHRVGKFCTEPSVIRLLAAKGEDEPARHDLSSLKILGSFGEEISPETWLWYHDNVGKGQCPVVSIWSQTESGGPMMAALPGVAPITPGSVGGPFFGVEPIILDLDTGEETRFPNQEGGFFIGRPWPGMARTVLNDHQTYVETYFAPFQNLFITGDAARMDEDRNYWITGRIDDVMKIAGHRIGAWEIESALVSCDQVVEAAVVGFVHPIKGQGLYAFVTLTAGTDKSDGLQGELKDMLRSRIGTMAVPDVIQYADALPKTRSGKILRRLLQKIASGEVDNLGDTTTVANPKAIHTLIRDRIGMPAVTSSTEGWK